jgi:hypothetical protein
MSHELRRRLVPVTAACVTAVLALLAVIDLWFYHSGLRWVLQRVEERTEIKIEFARATGSLFSGSAELAGVRALRRPGRWSGLELDVARVTLDCRTTSFLAGDPLVDVLELEGVRGRYLRVPGHGKKGARRDLLIRDFRVKSLSLLIHDAGSAGSAGDPGDAGDAGSAVGTGGGHRVEIDSLRCARFSRQWAVFDLLLRSEMRGRIDGHPFTVSCGSEGTAHRSEWRAAGLPVPILSSKLGATWAWLRDGTLDATVTGKYRPEGAGEIELTFRFDMKNAVPVPPPDASLATTLVFEQLRRLGTRRPLEATVRFSRASIEWAASVGPAGVWDGLKDRLTVEVARRVHLPVDRFRQLIARPGKSQKPEMTKKPEKPND